MLLAPPLADFAVQFGPAEYFSLMAFGLAILSYVTHGSIVKSLMMACLGLVLGLVGIDSITAMPRLTFDRLELVDGVGLVPMVMGLFCLAAILFNIDSAQQRPVVQTRHGTLMPPIQDWIQCPCAPQVGSP